MLKKQFKTNGIEIDFYKKNGYICKDVLTEDILNIFKDEVTRIVINAARNKNIELPNNFKLQDYHLFFNDDIHSSIWAKKARLFEKKFLESTTIKVWLNKICSLFGQFKVLDIEKINYPEIYFRLVRPSKNDDISGAHTDGVFYTFANSLPESVWKNWVKVWFPICFEPDLNSLGIYFNSHNKKIHFIRSNEFDKDRPILTDDINSFGTPSFPVRRVGQALFFSPHLLHCAYNFASIKTRISVEFAIGSNQL